MSPTLNVFPLVHSRIHKGPLSAYLPIICCVVLLSQQVTRRDKLKKKRKKNLQIPDKRTSIAKKECSCHGAFYFAMTNSVVISEVGCCFLSSWSVLRCVWQWLSHIVLGVSFFFLSLVNGHTLLCLDRWASSTLGPKFHQIRDSFFMLI